MVAIRNTPSDRLGKGLILSYFISKIVFSLKCFWKIVTVHKNIIIQNILLCQSLRIVSKFEDFALFYRIQSGMHNIICAVESVPDSLQKEHNPIEQAQYFIMYFRSNCVNHVKLC